MSDNSGFVERFEAAWSSRDPDRLEALLHPDVVLLQPLLPRIEGRAAARRSFALLLSVLPDLRIAVHRWCAQNALVFIEFSFSGTLGRKNVSWPLADRIVLSDGLIRERVSYFDPLPLLRAAALHPKTLWKLARARAR